MSRKIRYSLMAAGLLLLLSAALWFVPSVKFSAYLSAAAAGGLILWAMLCRWSEKSKAGKLCKVIFLACFCIGLAGFLAIEILLVTRGRADNSALEADAVIVLGAGVNGTTPSLALRTRIDAAAAYLEQHPNVPAVLSGGQGPGEDITEAQAMYAALTARGIDGERLFLEGRSTSTAENFAYSKELLAEIGIDPEEGVFAVVTNDFHCVRAHLIARRAGMQVFDIPAALPGIWLSGNYYVREAFAMVKTVVLD